MYNPSNIDYVTHSYYLGSLRAVIHEMLRYWSDLFFQSIMTSKSIATVTVPTKETWEVTSVPKGGAM
jgi:hypothetical protein